MSESPLYILLHLIQTCPEGSVNPVLSARSLCTLCQSFQLISGISRELHSWRSYSVWCSESGEKPTEPCVKSKACCSLKLSALIISEYGDGDLGSRQSRGSHRIQCFRNQSGQRFWKSESEKVVFSDLRDFSFIILTISGFSRIWFHFVLLRALL